MLKKLLKYELDNIFRFLVIFYSLAIFFAFLTRIFFGIENSFVMNIVAQVCNGITISMMANILINNVMRLWVRFKNNLYGDESYLTHTLPISKKDIYLSKVLTMIISSFVSMLVITLVLFIAYYSKDNLDLLKNLLLPVANMYDISIVGFLIVVLFIFFLEIVNTLQVGYTGIILGHKCNNIKVGFSVLFGFFAYLGMQMFVLMCTFIVAIFNKDMMNLFVTNEIINVDVLKKFLYLAVFVYTAAFIIEYIINIKLFKKGVNVD